MSLTENGKVYGKNILRLMVDESVGWGKVFLFVANCAVAGYN